MFEGGAACIYKDNFLWECGDQIIYTCFNSNYNYGENSNFVVAVLK